MSLSRYLGMLGLCMRARRLVSGEHASVQAVRAGRAYAVLLDESAAHNTTKSVNDACVWHGVPLISVPSNALGQAIGKPGRMVVAITDHSFARRILQLAQTTDAENRTQQ